MQDVTGGQFVLITLVGALVGIVAGMFGIGGGFLIVPVLHIVLGVPIQTAVGSAACQILGPATTSVLARRVTRSDLKLPLIVAGGLFVGVFAGAGLLHRLTSGPTSGDASAEQGEAVVLWVYLLMLAALGGFSLWESGRELTGRPVRTGWLSQLKLRPTADLEGISRPVSIVALAWFGLFVGVLSGLLGISGGLLILPGLVYLVGLEWHRSVTTSMLIVWLVAVQSTIAHSLHDHIRLSIVVALLLGGTIGARIGVEWSRSVSPVHGRRSFGWLALAAAAGIALKVATATR